MGRNLTPEVIRLLLVNYTESKTVTMSLGQASAGNEESL